MLAGPRIGAEKLFFLSQHTNQSSRVLIYFVEEFCWTHWNFTGMSASPADLFAALLLYLSTLLFLFSPTNIVPWGFCRVLSFLHGFFYCLDLSFAVFVMEHLLFNSIGKCNFREKKSCKFWKRVSFVNTWTFAKSTENLNVEIWKPNNNVLQIIHVKRDIWQTCCVISGLRYYICNQARIRIQWFNDYLLSFTPLVVHEVKWNYAHRVLVT